MRLAAAGAFVWLGFFVYGVSADAFHYSTVGAQLSRQFQGVGWAVFQPPWTSTHLISNLCGLVFLVTGDAMPTLFVLFAFAGLWGGYFFYRAFCIAFPAGNRGLYGLLVVLTPSLLYWSSAIGKDALEQLFIGIAAYGFARLTRQLNPSSIAITIAGLVGSAMVRPHVGAMLAISMLVPFTMGRSKTGWMAASAKILLVPLLAAGTFVMIRQAQTFVGVEGTDFKSSVQRLKVQTKNSDIGGSTFNEGESLSRRILQGPFLTFRPFPWEVHNAMSALAGVEGLALAVFAWRKRRNALAVLRQWRNAYVMFLLVFATVFSVIFAAATSNFGILVRQRIMVVPIVLMLFCAISDEQLPITLRKRPARAQFRSELLPVINR